MPDLTLEEAAARTGVPLEPELIVPFDGPSDPPAYPVTRLRDAIPFLRRPFTPNAVKFKVQATWDNGGLVVAYIDARLVIDRLNMICPDLWDDKDGYVPLGTTHMICRLTIDGTTRQDVGEGRGKGLYSDALKRAAVKFGIGVSLYAIPKMVLSDADGLERKTRGGKTTVTLTAKGEKKVRDLYEAWLKDTGIALFGEPLDHGDSVDAVGDVDAAPEPATEEPIDLGDVEVTEDYAKELVDAVWKAGLSPQLQMAVQHITKRDDVPPLKTKGAAVKMLAASINVGQAGAIERWIQKHTEETKP